MYECILIFTLFTLFPFWWLVQIPNRRHYFDIDLILDFLLILSCCFFSIFHVVFVRSVVLVIRVSGSSSSLGPCNLFTSFSVTTTYITDPHYTILYSTSPSVLGLVYNPNMIPKLRNIILAHLRQLHIPRCAPWGRWTTVKGDYKWKYTYFPYPEVCQGRHWRVLFPRFFISRCPGKGFVLLRET